MAEKKGFDLAAVLSNVSNLNTGATTDREQIEYIDIDLIDADDRNFYELPGIEDLAANIQLVGLQQPLRVRDGADSHVIIISGHRRHAALRLLVHEGLEKFRQVPCIRSEPITDEQIFALLDTADASVERIADPDATDKGAELKSLMSELALIYANSDTRRMTSADLSKQAERTEMLLYRLKEAGLEFPGRMRDHVAEACKISKSKLARLKVIREKLIPKIMPLYEDGTINESVAYALAKMPPEMQQDIITYKPNPQHWAEYYVEQAQDNINQIRGQKCAKCGGDCTYQVERLTHNFDNCNHDHCTQCCATCFNRLSCKDVCPELAAEIKAEKQQRKDIKKQERLDAQTKAAPRIAKITAIWQRFAQAREASGKSIEDCLQAAGIYVTNTVVRRHADYEAGREKITEMSILPFGYSGSISDIEKIIGVADLLGVSVDYLLCRTDEQRGAVGAELGDPDAGV